MIDCSLITTTTNGKNYIIEFSILILLFLLRIQLDISDEAQTEFQREFWDSQTPVIVSMTGDASVHPGNIVRVYHIDGSYRNRS